MKNFIEEKLIQSPQFEETSTEDLLHIMEGYGLVKKIVSESSAMIGRTLLELKLYKKGILVLGIERDSNWIPAPQSSEALKAFDRLVVYGLLSELKLRLEE